MSISFCQAQVLLCTSRLDDPTIIHAIYNGTFRISLMSMNTYPVIYIAIVKNEPKYSLRLITFAFYINLLSTPPVFLKKWVKTLFPNPCW